MATKHSMDDDWPSIIYSKESFVILNVLGNGAYGTVYHARLKHTKEEYALKQLNKQQILRHGKKDAVFRERDILEILAESPFFIKIISSF